LLVSEGVRFEPSDNTVRLVDVQVERFVIDGLPASWQRQLDRIGKPLARGLLEDQVLYTLRPKDVAELEGRGLRPGDLRVTASGVRSRYWRLLAEAAIHSRWARPLRSRLLRARENGLDLLLLVKAAVMGVVEGLTEFLPISSTGHLILAGSLLGFAGEKVKVFEIAIQSGAIFAVMIVYRERLAATLSGLGSDAQARRFALNVAIAFVPAVLLVLWFWPA
jgi:hypothetical protein